MYNFRINQNQSNACIFHKILCENVWNNNDNGVFGFTLCINVELPYHHRPDITLNFSLEKKQVSTSTWSSTRKKRSSDDKRTKLHQCDEIFV
jgi:hypothetical protein